MPDSFSAPLEFVSEASQSVWVADLDITPELKSGYKLLLTFDKTF